MSSSIPSPAPKCFSGSLVRNGCCHPCHPSLDITLRSPIFWCNIGVSGNRRWLSDVTRILESIEHGDPKAADELLPLVYGELRKLAASRMANEAPNQTLQPTALVHEAWLRLVGGVNQNIDGPAHFFAAAAEAMRRILIDKGRRKRAVRHGGDQQRVDIPRVASKAMSYHSRDIPSAYG